MRIDQSLSLTELSADICNKLQIAKTVLEQLKANKKVDKKYIDRAIKDLEKAVKMINILQLK